VTTALLIAGAVVLVGAVVQGVVGYGLNLIAAPLLTLVDPALIPVPVLLVALVQSVMSLLRERSSAHWSGVGWAMVGRLPGNVLGVLAVSALPVAGFTVAIALSVLACVALSLVSWRPRPTRPSLVVAGTASGAFGTASAIGGPPIALLYQHSAGPTIRATLAAFFLLASVSSLATLGIAGEIGTEHLRAAAVLLPFMLAGFALSTVARRIVDSRGAIRAGILGVAAASALVLLVRGLFG
jgi:uncharacterized membrane protein YfcA